MIYSMGKSIKELPNPANDVLEAQV
jgi:hypothetical protein